MSRARAIRDDRGVTLTELLVVVLVMTVLLGATLAVLDSATKAERGQQSRGDAADSLRIAMARVTRDLRQASRVDPASAADSLVMDTVVNGADTLVVYEVVGGVLQRRVGTSAPDPIVERVLTSTTRPFCYDPPACTGAAPTSTPPSVRVVLEIQPDVSDAPSIKLATTIKLRNA